jgi:hypothetical protein
MEWVLKKRRENNIDESILGTSGNGSGVRENGKDGLFNSSGV